ncbi:lysozyme g-like [Cololabis saira]|uniref:lysozyme g-like n=1 Tax=Cololabis saira TaxID=129043 RepID=UPI002AD22635|nr:lysozyme g-like [Cololabis saira]
MMKLKNNSKNSIHSGGFAVSGRGCQERLCFNFTGRSEETPEKRGKTTWRDVLRSISDKKMATFFSSLFSSLFGSTTSKYGDIMEVETTGASKVTAQQDKLRYSGVAASETMAKMDAERMKKYKTKILNVAKSFDIDPAIIAAIISRESRAGNTIKDNNGWGDWNTKRKAFNAFGLMQVDVNPKGGNHTAEGEWDSETHIQQGTRILVDFIDKFSSWPKEQQLKGGIAAYNAGDLNVESYANVDKHTTGRDYSNDVVARAKWYKENFSFE